MIPKGNGFNQSGTASCCCAHMTFCRLRCQRNFFCTSIVGISINRYNLAPPTFPDVRVTGRVVQFCRAMPSLTFTLGKLFCRLEMRSHDCDHVTALFTTRFQ